MVPASLLFTSTGKSLPIKTGSCWSGGGSRNVGYNETDLGGGGGGVVWGEKKLGVPPKNPGGNSFSSTLNARKTKPVDTCQSAVLVT